MAGVKRKDGYTDLTDRLDKLNKEIKKKEEEFKKSGGQAIMDGFTEKQKDAFQKMTNQEQAVYLAKKNPTAGKQWGELAPKYNQQASLKKEIDEKHSKVSDNEKFKEANKQVEKRRKEFKDLEKEVAELKASIALYSNPTLCQQKGIKDRLASLEGTKSLLEMKEKELKAAAKNLGQAKGDLNRVVKETMSEDSKKAVKAKEEIKERTTKPRKKEQIKTVEVTLPEVAVVGQNKMKKPSIVASEVKGPELKDVKIKFTPTVTLVPHIKKNGKPSKRHFDIQLRDADGKLFILTEKMMDKVTKQQGNSAATREEMVAGSWDNYVKLAKEGRLQPETVASFFKGQVNMGNNANVEETTKDVKSQGLTAQDHIDRHKNNKDAPINNLFIINKQMGNSNGG